MIVYEYRSGLGFDIHRFTTENPKPFVVLGGVNIPHSASLEGHSDADVVLHAVMDALLGTVAAGDIGMMFPNSDPQYKGISSLILLAKVAELLAEHNASIVNIDVSILAEAPRLAAFYPNMVANIAHALKIAADRVNVKSTTLEKLGDLGKGDGIAAMASASVKIPFNQQRMQFEAPPAKNKPKKVNPDIKKLKPLTTDLFKVTIGADDEQKVPKMLKAKSTKTAVQKNFDLYDESTLELAIDKLKTTDHINVFCDGGARGNPGNAGIGVVLCDAESIPVCGLHKNLGYMTNNQAEYNGLIYALQVLADNKLTQTPITIYMDSELVIKQITGIYRIQNPQLIELFATARSLLGQFAKYRLQHIPREQNSIADKLANQAMDEA